MHLRWGDVPPETVAEWVDHVRTTDFATCRSLAEFLSQNSVTLRRVICSARGNHAEDIPAGRHEGDLVAIVHEMDAAVDPAEFAAAESAVIDQARISSSRDIFAGRYGRLRAEYMRRAHIPFDAASMQGAGYQWSSIFALIVVLSDEIATPADASEIFSLMRQCFRHIDAFVGYLYIACHATPTLSDPLFNFVEAGLLSRAGGTARGLGGRPPE